MIMKPAKFSVSAMLPLGITLVVLGIALAYGLQVMGDTQDDIGEAGCADRTDGYTGYDSDTNLCYNVSNSSQTSALTDSAEFNATGDAITGVAKFPEKLPIIAGVIVAVIIIGLLVRNLIMK